MQSFNTPIYRNYLSTTTIDSSKLDETSNISLVNQNSKTNGSSNNSKSVTDILREPINFQYYSSIADELAEIVSKYTHNLRFDDGDNIVVTTVSTQKTTRGNSNNNSSSSSNSSQSTKITA